MMKDQEGSRTRRGRRKLDKEKRNDREEERLEVKEEYD